MAKKNSKTKVKPTKATESQVEKVKKTVAKKKVTKKVDPVAVETFDTPTDNAEPKAPAKKKRAPKKVAPTPKNDFKEIQQDSTELNGEGNRERGEEGEDLLSAPEADIPVEAVIKSASEMLREERRAAVERQIAVSEERKANDKMITGTILMGIAIIVGFTAFALISLGII